MYKNKIQLPQEQKALIKLSSLSLIILILLALFYAGCEYRGYEYEQRDPLVKGGDRTTREACSRCIGGKIF